MANVVVKLVATGRVIPMLYDDDTSDARIKSREDEVLVPLSAVTGYNVIYRI
jgi:hypothetical protein